MTNGEGETPTTLTRVAAPPGPSYCRMPAAQGPQLPVAKALVASKAEKS